MRFDHQHCPRGFTLIELMVAVAIVAILATIAYASYKGQIVKTHRSDGHIALSNAAQGLERCYTEFGSYDSASCQTTFPMNSSESYYRLTAELNPSTYTLTATPQGSQADDSCGALTLDNTGQKGSDGPVSSCW